MPCSSHSKFRQGFSLVELSIVLVITGLLVGGILVGSDMIRSTELKEFAEDLHTTQTNMQLFKSKYGKPPGDFNEAVDLWSSSVSNGNGDMQIRNVSNEEQESVWEHLSKAKLVLGTYTGSYGSGHEIGVNVPESSISGVGLRVSYGTQANRTGTQLIAATPVPSAIMNDGFLTPGEAFELDRKIDDGFASKGDIYGLPALGDASKCMDTSVTPMTYLTNDNKECAILKWLP
ncbi:MAG: prepilin-type N-terminal cleavage/methylation domain-containing protein [Alphaproteobacteria bacterium]|nr:prepilin-type N-terminal cleavage/methylation domain-containing protein [Alphaproteobacteria bacterium]